MLGYKAALDWIIQNDDYSSIYDKEPLPPVTLSFVCDIYDKDLDKAMRDLRKRADEKEGF